MCKTRIRRLLSIVLSAACILALASCGTGASAETEMETTTEKASAREDVSRAGWSLGDIEALNDVVMGITDREYAAGEGAAYKMFEDITYDRRIVYTVLFNTAFVRFDTPGVYDMIYWVYFDAAALKAWADENGADLDIPDAGRLTVWVPATVTVTEAEEDEDAEDAEDTVSGVPEDESASAGAGSGSESGSGSSSKSTASGSSKSSSSTSCSHNWVDEGHYESVLVQAAYDSREKVGSTYQCNGCDFQSDDPAEIGAHARANGCPGSYKTVYVYETVHHDAVYETKWVSSYKCSKCGATK